MYVSLGYPYCVCSVRVVLMHLFCLLQSSFLTLPFPEPVDHYIMSSISIIKRSVVLRN